MRIFTTLLLLMCSVFAFGKSVSVDTTFSISAIGSTTVCGNDSVNIVSNGCSGNVVWSNGTESPSIRALQSGDYFATCVPTSEVSNTITVTLLPTPNPPTIALEVINSQNILTATGCTGEVLWSTNEVSTSISATVGGLYFAFCRPTGTFNCSSRPSNIFNVSAPTPAISANKTILCEGERANLTAAGCPGTVSWSNGFTGSTIQIPTVGNYYAYCTQNGIQSSPSNIVEITALNIVPPIIYSLDNVYCLHPTVTLTTSSCPEGNIIWSNGVTSTSITVSVAGTYSTQCQNQCGLSPASNIVTVLANGGSIVVPAAPFISTTKDRICNGESAVLTATGCNETIVWNNGTTSSAITVSQIGLYSAICQNQCSNSESSNIITIQAGFMPTSPVISTTKNNLCNGETATLTASGCSGNILWSNGMTTSVITVTQNGSYTSYTAICQTSGECGNSNPSNPIVINTGNVPTAPVISSNKTIMCDGEFATLTASGCLGTVLWSTGATTNAIQLIVSGTYTAICRNQCGESGPSNSIVLRSGISPITPSAVSNKSIICNGETAVLSATGCNGTFIWNNGATVTSISITVAGTYSVRCQTICGNSAASNEVIVKSSIAPSSPIIVTNKASICNNEIATLSSTGCLGNVVWSNGATGISAQVSKGGIYTALCQNVCGTSANSNILTITQLISQCTPIKIRKVK